MRVASSISIAVMVRYAANWPITDMKLSVVNPAPRVLNESGFRIVRFIGAGRLPFLWKSMIMVAQKLPSES